MHRDDFLKHMKTVSSSSGVYLLKDNQGAILYVGKAKNIRHRLRSYFRSLTNAEPKIRKMMDHFDDFEYIVTQSESEALILENNLIKNHKPHYNARLKDDKNYPYIKIDLQEDYPQLYFTRQVLPDGARYFGPFASGSSVRITLNLLKKLFPYRSCNRVITRTDDHACLEYHINRCVAPCIGAVTREEYRRIIEQVIMFLEGKTDTVVRELRNKMSDASQNWQFERAAVIRDQVQAIERVSQTQKVVSTRKIDQDVIALARGHDETLVEMFFIRKGKVIGRDHFLMEGTEDEEDGSVLGQFIQQFYSTSPFVPPNLLLQHTANDTLIIRNWLTMKRGGNVRIQVPQKGDQRKLMELVMKNAEEALQQWHVRWFSNTDIIQQALEELQEALNLPSLPKRIECYDISNIQGTNPTGSMVVMENGQPNKSEYRRFKIQSVVGVNDYAMIQEVLRRRFKRLIDSHNAIQIAKSSNLTTDTHNNEATQTETWGTRPQLVLIDGGKGHLSAALEVFLEMGIDNVSLASIAKKREELYLPHSPEPVVLPRSSHALHIVQRIRDEAHRFAITYHRSRRSKNMTASILDQVPGIGPKRKKMLLQRFGSITAIRKATSNDIAAVHSMTLSLAMHVKKYL